jgi:hypothetical protein
MIAVPHRAKVSRSILSMDAGLIGGLIGLGIMVCGVSTAVLYDKGGRLMRGCQQRIDQWKQPRQPLLPVGKENPLVVKRTQFQMKELLRKN